MLQKTNKQTSILY